MKKSRMIIRLHRFLERYDGCKIRKKETEEILDFLTSEGMLPPGVESKWYKELYGHDWDYEPMINYEWEK